MIVPDRHGTGTNALALDPRGAFEPQFGPGSRARHVRAGARPRGSRTRSITVPSPRSSTSTPARTRRQLGARSRGSPAGRRARAACAQIGRAAPPRHDAAARPPSRVPGLPEVEPGDRPGGADRRGRERRLRSAAATCVVVSQKVVSKAEGRLVRARRRAAVRARAASWPSGSARTRGWCSWCSTRAPRCCAPSAAC